MYRSILPVFFLMFSLVACDTANSNKSPGIDSQVRIVFRNSDGNNLLSPDRPHSINDQNTDIYYLIDGKEKKIFRGNLDDPKMFHVFKGDSTIPYAYFMLLNANIVRGEETATTFIKFDDASMDTVKVTYELSDNIYAGGITKVWYNHKLRWSAERDAKENPLRYILVTKDWE